MKLLQVRTLKYYTTYNNISEYQLLEDLDLPDPDDCSTFEECNAQQKSNTRAILEHFKSQGYTHICDHENNAVMYL